MTTERVDKLLHGLGYADSRAAAQKLIAEGAVSVCDAGRWLTVTKASQKFDDRVEFRIEACAQLQYVSRAGLKLAAGLAWFQQHIRGFELRGCIALDIGQSTGGFTDCLLQHGVAHVVGVDVGHGQLAVALREDARVTCLEGINARDLSDHTLSEFAPQGFDLSVVDVSFISQTKILPGIARLTRPGGYLVSLIKPQFEVGPARVGKGGLVTSDASRRLAQERVAECAKAEGFEVVQLLQSPIAGGDGNREYLLLGCLKADLSS